MHTPLPLTLRLSALTLALTAAGCGEAIKDPPEGHDALLDTAAGVAAFELVITPDLWERTAYITLEEEVKATTPGPDLADRGLKMYTLTGPQLISYLNDLERSVYGGWLEGGSLDGAPLHQRVYDEITPVLMEVDGPRGPEDPAPRVVLDETITDA